MSTPDPLGIPGPRRAALEELALDLARTAGAFIRDERPEGLGVASTKATDLDVVTEMDTRCETLLREQLAARRPDDAILGEEDGISEGTSGLTWVLDPIDGTVNYLYDLPAYAVSVAVVVGDSTVPGAWRPVAGAVINPRTDEVFHAHAGGGARLSRAGRTPVILRLDDSPQAAVHPDGELAAALLATGFSYDRGVRVDQAKVLAELLPRVRDIRRMGAAALDLCHVAAGRVDGYWETGTQAWDVAAGRLIVTEAGGLVTGRAADAPPSPDMVVAARRSVHAAMLRAICEPT